MKSNRTRVSVNGLTLFKKYENEIINVKSTVNIDQLLIENILRGFNKIFKKIGNGFTLKISQADNMYSIKGSSQIIMESTEKFDLYKSNLEELFKVIKNGLYNNAFNELLNSINDINLQKSESISFDGITFLFSMLHYKVIITIYNEFNSCMSNEQLNEYYKFMGRTKFDNISSDYVIDFDIYKEEEKEEEEKLLQTHVM